MVGMSPSRFLHPFAPPAKEEYLPIVRGSGSLVWDADGKEYLDGMAALWFVNAGYGRREIVDAIAEQGMTLHTYHTFDPFTLEPTERLAERIAALAPIDDPRVFFCQSGSEAVDSAIKLARASHVEAGRPERQLIVKRTTGYHGTNLGGTSAQGIPPNREGLGPLAPEFVQLPHHDLEAMATLFAERGNEIAAVLTEPIQGAGGVYPPEDGYLPALRRLCDDHGAYLISDEVICGFGRLGTWFGCEHYGVRPDIITFAKAITSGYMPLGGVILGAPVREPLEADPSYILRTGYTYSGHATSTAAGLACLDVLEADGLLAAATSLGSQLRAGLQSVVDDGVFKGIRGDGFVWAVETHDHQTPAGVRNTLLEKGLIVRPLGDALAICPPLVTTPAQVDRIVDTLASV